MYKKYKTRSFKNERKIDISDNNESLWKVYKFDSLMCLTLSFHESFQQVWFSWLVVFLLSSLKLKGRKCSQVKYMSSSPRVSYFTDFSSLHFLYLFLLLLTVFYLSCFSEFVLAEEFLLQFSLCFTKPMRIPQEKKEKFKSN